MAGNCAFSVAGGEPTLSAAGQTRAGSYVPGMATLINHPDWDVAESAMDKLEVSIDILSVDEQDRVSPSLLNIVKRDVLSRILVPAPR